METTDLLKWALNVFELIACFTGFFYWKKIKTTYWKFFPVFLAVIILIEIAGKIILVAFDDIKLNSSMYRYFGIPIQFLFYFWLFRKYFSDSAQRYWPLGGLVIYVFSWGIEMLFFEKVQNWFMSFSYTIGNIVLLVLIITFFVKFIQSEEILKYRESTMFWVCLGLLSFYLGTFPFYSLRNTLFYNYREVFNIYYYVNFGLDYLMYLFFTIAFIWGKPK